MGLTDMGGDVLADAIFGRKWDQSWDGCDQPPAALSVGPSSNLACICAVRRRELVYASLDSFSNSPESANLGFNSLSLVNKIPYTKPYAGHKQYREGLEPIIPQPAQYRQQYCNKRDVHLVHFAIP